MSAAPERTVLGPRTGDTKAFVNIGGPATERTKK